MTTRIRPLALALGLGLAVAAASPDAGAQRKRAGRAPAVPAQCTDFYAQANADWLQAHPASAPDAAASALAGLAERALQQQRELLEEAMRAPRNEVQKLLGDFWASGLDSRFGSSRQFRPVQISPQASIVNVATTDISERLRTVAVARRKKVFHPEPSDMVM